MGLGFLRPWLELQNDRGIWSAVYPCFPIMKADIFVGSGLSAKNDLNQCPKRSFFEEPNRDLTLSGRRISQKSIMSRAFFHAVVGRPAANHMSPELK